MKNIQEDIKTGKFKQAYLLYGEEAYLKQQYKRNLEREEALNEAVLDAEDQEVWKHWNKD